MITIELRDASGNILAAAGHAFEALLCVDRVYQPGDQIVLSGARHLFVQMDQGMPAGEIFLPQGKMTWNVPAGEHRFAYAPGIFAAQRHVISARMMSEDEIAARRNIACNPADLRGNTDFYPHCTANVETRNEACFCARNVIDGLRLNTYHGEWPYQSWGIGAREDARCRLDFGRDVRVDEMALTLRADFPHDAYWTGGHVLLSDGTDMAFSLKKSGDRQVICLGRRVVRWMQLERMIKSDDPSAFPALTEWEVWGADL
ncbi:MAG: carbohydrate-binding protein [Clostridia bacterium]|nr:carbohydrate-binding protein [Clostridia bacterium]